MRCSRVMLDRAGKTEGNPVEIRRKVLLESETLQIGLFETRRSSDACGDVERQNLK